MVEKVIYKFLLLIAAFFVSKAYAQQVIEITFCNEMKKGSVGNMIVLSLIQGRDTLSFPSLGNNKFINPLQLCGEPITYDRQDTTKATILLENCKYEYVFEIDNRDLYCPYLEFCLDGKRHPNGSYVWSYLNCQAIGTAGVTKRTKK